MADLSGKLGIGGGIGAIVGIALMIWVAPDTNPGRVVLVAVPALIGTTIGAIVSALQACQRCPQRQADAEEK